MRKLLLLAVLAFGMNVSAQQTYDLDKSTGGGRGVTYTETLDKATYKGVEYPVFKSKTGKLFIFVVPKSGKKYRKYITLTQTTK